MVHNRFETKIIYNIINIYTILSTRFFYFKKVGNITLAWRYRSKNTLTTMTVAVSVIIHDAIVALQLFALHYSFVQIHSETCFCPPIGTQLLPLLSTFAEVTWGPDTCTTIESVIPKIGRNFLKRHRVRLNRK